MKKILLIAMTFLLITSCSEDSSSGGNLSDTPDANAEHDTSNFGIYKGVFVGSSGVVTVNINNDNSITAKLRINGV
ncbi:MAG TPA: hypothetical protein VGB50_04335, partial [Flavobacterium sp.]